MGQSVRSGLLNNQNSEPDTSCVAFRFFNGIDSMVFARIQAEKEPFGEPFHLTSVTLGNNPESLDNCPDRGTAITDIQELR